MAAAAAAAKATKAAGDELWKRTDKINAELFTLTYGALVVQLIQDYEEYGEVNKQLERMGYSMGTRLIEDFLARTGAGRCRDLQEVAEMLAKVGFRSFLNISPTVIYPTQQGQGQGQGPVKEFSLVFDENPLAEFVELPEDALPPSAGSQTQGQAQASGTSAKEGLWFSNVLCGVIRGALEMIQYSVTAEFVSDVLRGDETTEIKVTLLRILDEELPPGDD